MAGIDAAGRGLVMDTFDTLINTEARRHKRKELTGVKTTIEGWLPPPHHNRQRLISAVITCLMRSIQNTQHNTAATTDYLLNEVNLDAYPLTVDTVCHPYSITNPTR